MEKLTAGELAAVPLAVIDCAAAAEGAALADLLVDVTTIAADEARHGRIPTGALVCRQG